MTDGVPIVVVDDDDAHRDLIELVLRLVVPDAAVLALGAAAVERLPELAPRGATVLMDRRLGTADALAELPSLRRTRPDIAVVMMSAFVTPEDRVRCHAAGASDIFQKPGDLNGWRSVLGSLFGDAAPLSQAA